MKRKNRKNKKATVFIDVETVPFHSIQLPTIRRSEPTLLANKLVGVTPDPTPSKALNVSTTADLRNIPYTWFHSFAYGYGIYDENGKAVYLSREPERYETLRVLALKYRDDKFLDTIRITNVDRLNEIIKECELGIERSQRMYAVYSDWETAKGREPRPFESYAQFEMWKLTKATERMEIVLSPSGV